MIQLNCRFTILVLVLVIVVAGCHSQSTDYEDPKLTPEAVVAVSNSYLSQQDVDVALYEIDRVGFDYVNRTWHLSYEGTRGILHDYYWVKVSDEDVSEIEIGGR